MDSLKLLDDRFQESKQYKDRWLALYSQLYMFVIPDRDAFNEKWNYRDDGKPNTQNIWDSTPVLAAYQRANDLLGLLMPKDRVWGKLILDPHMFSQEVIANTKKELDDWNDQVFFYLNESNLYRVASSSNLDLVGGTGVMWVESISDEIPLYFRSVPAVCVYIEYSTDDTVSNCWYVAKMSGRQIINNFPKYKGKCREELVEKPNEIYQIRYGQIKIDDNNFYIYAVLENDPFYALFERNNPYEQIIVYRDRVRPGEAEGRGVGIDLLPQIMDLNQIVRDDRKSLAFKANPPVFYDADKYFNPYQIRQWAGAMIARNPSGRNPLEAFQLPESPEVMERIQDLRNMIKIGFQVDPLGEIDTPVKSATEISIRENRAQRTSATDISRLINELPKQIYTIATKILWQRKLLNKQRVIEGNFNPKKFRFDFQSPLYDLQKQDNIAHLAGKMQMIQQFMGEGAAIAMIDEIELNRTLTDWFNLPSKLFKSDDQLRAFISNMAQAQQQGQLPQPSTQGSNVQLPQQSQVQI